MIRVENLEVYYEALKVLKGVCAEFGRGSFVGILGPNGAGKTTLLRAMASLIGFEGRVEVFERNIRKLPRREVARLISMVPQDFQMDLEFSVMEIVLMGRYPYLGPFKFDGEEDYEIALGSLKKTNSAHLRDRMFKNMSSGERQRVLIAMALAQEAKMMLLDEPTSNLDLHHSVEIMRLLRKLADEGVTVVASMHNINLASLYCDRIVLLNKGRIAGDGSPREVLNSATIREVYGIEVIVDEHPVTGRPQVFLLP
ncbi:ABC transporter ATP-binding protein [Candidatus Pyrohabitans sp.]